jgi:AcrR family transcriptional regulator
VALRRAATTAEIVDAAWELADRDGLNGFSLRDVAKAVSMQPPSLYSYVASKNDLFDLMFRHALDEMLAEQAALPVTGDARTELLASSRAFLSWCMAHPARYTLLFLRTVPGFEPSEESMAKAFELYDGMRAQMAALGVTDQAHLDLWTGVMNGLAAQQIANEPHTDRWTRLVEDALTMFLAHVAPTRRSRR